MSRHEMVIEGTLRPDGTLELDGKPDFPPGRVTVVLRQEVAMDSPQGNWWQSMQRSRRELEAAGAKFMNESEVHAHIEWLREGDRLDESLQRAEPS
jgi:hypothetical protein